MSGTLPLSNKPINLRLMGIDHGLKRIGLAVSDTSGLIARELVVVYRKTNKEDFESINRVAQEQHVSGYVIGLPVNSDAAPDEYTQRETVQRWIDRFAETTALPITTWDEQLTSADARELSIQKHRHMRDPIDDLAARLILQSFLDALRDGLTELPDTFKK